MSFAITAAVGAAAVGSIYSANKASSSADKASKRASAADAAALEFSKEQYQDWLDAFGDIQTNLSEYYNNLTPAFIETQGLQAIEEERQRAMEFINEDLARRGIESSGLAAEVTKEVTMSAARERAKVRAEAPINAAKEQLNFLQVGYGLNPASSIQQTLANQASGANAVARDASAYASRAQGAAVESTFNVLSSLLQRVDFGSSSAPDNGLTDAGWV